MVLGMTHEEVIAWLAAREIRSYRDLPQIWYQIQTKERDEARPRSGVLRTREFVMKDSYTLDPDTAALDRSYAAHEGAYRTIFERCGLRFHVAHSDTGMMGGLGAHEFLAPSAAGEDEIALCAACGYAANVEIARGVPAAPAFPAGGREEVATPNARTIAQVSELLKIDPRLTIKSLLYATPSGFVLALVRGDHAIHERKLTRALGERAPRRPSRGGRRRSSGAPVGSVGPVGARVPIVADEALREGAYVVGANREGVHLRGVVPGRDFEARFADLHTVAAGEACPQCGAAAGGRAGHRDRQHLQARHQVLGGARRHVPGRVGQGAADRHGQLRHRAGPHRRRRHRAERRRRRHRVAGGHRALPGPHRRGEPARRRPGGRGRGDLRRRAGRPASTRSWTTVTSGPA